MTLIRQYRHAVGGYLWEVPAGKLEPGESPATCAARELAEEVGPRGDDPRALGSIVTCPGFCDEVIHLFLATGLRPVPMQRGADEVIDIRRAPCRWREAMDMIRTGEIRDAKTIAGLVQASLQRDRSGSGAA